MNYIEVSIQVEPDFRDILIAELAGYHYESFVETDDGVNAYCTTDLFSEVELEELNSRYSEVFDFHYSFQEIEQQNWNEEWEKNFQPLFIRGQVSVRASFHPKPDNAKYDIIINPKMSFGTGHHETTTLMLGLQLEVNHKNKTVLDMGCGTGILAIMAHKMGAAGIVAIDIEDWTVENAHENARINHAPIDVRLGDVSAIKETDEFDIILANINRNVLLNDMHRYVKHLSPGGTLLLSGFYEEDVPLIAAEAKKQGLTQQNQESLNRWTAMRFAKPL